MKYTLFFTMMLGSLAHGETLNSSLKNLYEYHSSTAEPSDIYEHLPAFRKYASECASVVEIGIREMNSSWGFLTGLAESSQPNRSYLGIDLGFPQKSTLKKAQEQANAHGIHFSFWKGNDLVIDLPKADLLFIDTLHTYCHLSYELDRFSPQIGKYILLHDTSPPWELFDDNEYWGNYAEYPEWIDRTKRGLWPAVEDFLKTHPEWKLHERRTNCHGLTVLKRVNETQLAMSSMESSAKVRVLFTSALLPEKFEERKAEYIHTLQQLKSFGFLSRTCVVESGTRTILSFFEEQVNDVFYSGSNNINLQNKGVNEAQSLINYCKTHEIGDEEIIVKLTGRYTFKNGQFLKYIEKHPEVDALISSRWDDAPAGTRCFQTGCYAIKGKYFKRWLNEIDLKKLEDEMIDIEWDFTRFIEKIIQEQANVEIWEKLGITAYIANLYYAHF